MAEKAKAKKAKTLSKKTSVKSKKRDEKEKDIEPEVLQLEAEEIPKRSIRAKASQSQTQTPAEKSAPATPSIQARADTETADASENNKIKSTTAVREEKEIKAQTTPEIIAPIQPRVVVNRPEAPRQEQAQAPQAQAHHRQETRKPEAENDGLRLRLSQSLTKKLKEQAADEGISLEEFVGELLAESVVLRAWEIVERKNAMKGHQPQGPNSGGRPGRDNASNQGGGNRGGQRQQGQNQGNKGHRGMSHVRYQTIMDDKATFLEYVRSQEKARR